MICCECDEWVSYGLFFPVRGPKGEDGTTPKALGAVCWPCHLKKHGEEE